MGCFWSCCKEERGYLYMKVPPQTARDLYEWGSRHIPDAQLAPKPVHCDARLEPEDYHLTLAVGVSPRALEGLMRLKMPSVVPVALGKLSTFVCPDREVVKVTVEPGSELSHLQRQVMSIGGKHIEKPSHPTWSPHLTICFAKPGLAIGENLKKPDAESELFQGVAWLADRLYFHVGGEHERTQEIVFHNPDPATCARQY